MNAMAELTYEAMELTDQIVSLLAGRSSGVQGAVLAELLATWLASYPKDTREELLARHVGAVRELISINESLHCNGDPS
jgi:hypothetical protein